MKTTYLIETHVQEKVGVDTVSTGWGSRKPTPEERLERVEEDVEKIDIDVCSLKKLHELASMDWFDRCSPRPWPHSEETQVDPVQRS